MLVVGFPTSTVQMKSMSVQKAIMNQDPCLVTS